MLITENGFFLNKVNEAYAWKCPVQSPEFELAGEILIYQATPLDAIHVQGLLESLENKTLYIYAYIITQLKIV